MKKKTSQEELGESRTLKELMQQTVHRVNIFASSIRPREALGGPRSKESVKAVEKDSSARDPECFQLPLCSLVSQIAFQMRIAKEAEKVLSRSAPE